MTGGVEYDLGFVPVQADHAGNINIASSVTGIAVMDETENATACFNVSVRYPEVELVLR